MGPGMMKGMQHQTTGLMKDMGSMVARTSSTGVGPMGSMTTPDMSKMMERMSEIQKHVSEVTGGPQKK